MNYHETLIPAPDLQARVLEKTAQARPLGAYATSARANYLFLEQTGVHALVVPLRPGLEIPPCANVAPLFDWDEREMHAERGVSFALTDARSAPAAAKEMTIAVAGPVHAGVIEPGRFTFLTGGESIARLDVTLQYSARGMERALEERDAIDAARLVARICAGCTVSRSLAYALALEALAGVECDEKSALARVVLAELERIYNHLFDLASTAAGAGYGRAQFAGLRLKERVMRMNALHGGNRMLFDAIVPGGVAVGVLREAIELRRELMLLREDVSRYIERFFAADSFVSRMRDAGTISHAMARTHGAVGPALRATGEPFDVRAYAPYGAYRTLAPVVASANAGDALARCHVKADEILASLTLAERALDQLGTRVPVEPVRVMVSAGRTVTLTEGPRGTETIALECDGRGALQRFHAISASYRNWPVVAVAMHDNIVPDFPLVNKSFNLCYACADR